MKRIYRPVNRRQKLGYFIEEAGESLAALGKTLRWGMDSVDPELIQAESDLKLMEQMTGGKFPGIRRILDRLHPGERNREWVLRELKDLERAIMYIRKTFARKN